MFPLPFNVLMPNVRKLREHRFYANSPNAFPWPCHFCRWHSSWSGTVEEFSWSCQIVKEVVQISSCNIWWVWSKICAELLRHCLFTLSLSLQNFSKIAKPITELLCKGKRYSWSSACQSAFDELKKKLTSAPILAPPDESQPFQVFCDASLQGLGGVLMQGKNIVDFNSRQL